MPWLTLSGSNYPCLEQISMVSKMYELLRFVCISIVPLWSWYRTDYDMSQSTTAYDKTCATSEDSDLRPAKTQISLRIRAVWSESSLIACVFYSLRAIQRVINKTPCHTRWMYRLIWVFAGHTGLIVGFIVRWLKFDCGTSWIPLFISWYWNQYSRAMGL